MAQPAVIGIPVQPQGSGHVRGYVTIAPNQQRANRHFLYEAGMMPSNAIMGPRLPSGIRIQETVFRDTPAPICCPHCSRTSMTDVRSKRSLATYVACMLSVVGICFLCPVFDCLWHKEHYCPNCEAKVAEFQKTDPCMVMDVNQWSQSSFAIPAQNGV